MRARTTLLTVAILAVLPAAARGQEAQVLTFVNAGKVAPRVDVSAFTNQGKVAVGETGTDGRLTIPPDATDFEDGERVAVWVRRCGDGEPEIVLIRDREGDPCEKEEERDREGCRCDKLGVFLWGRGPVVVDLAPNAAGPIRQRPPADGDGGLPVVVIGGGVDLASFPKLDDPCDHPNVERCETEDLVLGFQAALDYYRWLDRRLGVGFELLYFPGLEVEQDFSPVEGFPERNVTEMSVLSAGLRGIYRRPITPAGVLGFAIGLFWVRNQGDLETIWPGGETVTGSREESGLRVGASLGFDWWFRSPWGVRTEVGVSSGGADDIDTSVRLGLKLLFGMVDPDESDGTDGPEDGKPDVDVEA